MKNTVYIVTGVHNSLTDTKRFLKCISESDYSKIKVVIVDSGSTDGTREYIKSKYPHFILIEKDENVWWTGSIKSAIEYVLNEANAGDYVVTLNNDCVFEKKYISDLVKEAEKKEGAIIGSLVIDLKTGKIVDAGVKVNWRKGVFEPVKLNGRKVSKKLIKVDVLSTKGTVFPIKVFKEVGNFDDRNFPHYLSDYEFTCRARENGYTLYMYYGSVVLNDSQRTGLEGNKNKFLSVRELRNLLFSKKSKINLFDQFKFFFFHCPRKFKLQCGLSMVKKALYLISFFGPFYYVRQVFIRCDND